MVQTANPFHGSNADDAMDQLRADYDVIVIPSQGRSAKTLVYDIAPKTNQPRPTRSIVSLVPAD